MARGDDRPDSDVDILVELDPDAHVTVFDYVGVKEYIASLFLQPVDVIDREALSLICAGPRRAMRSMHSDPEQNALRDILRQIDLAQNFAQGQDRDAFSADIMRV
jgi:hypothetical protein